MRKLTHGISSGAFVRAPSGAILPARPEGGIKSEPDLLARIEALEARVAELEQKKSRGKK